MVSFQNFSKTYGNIPVLTIHDLTLAPGIYWVKGANGSGKSTLLKAIAGILHSEGHITLHALNLQNNTVAYRRQVSLAEAEPLFPEFLTGTEMIQLFASARKAAPGEEKHYIESMSMLPYINEPLGTYSSGMLKKLSLVMAFLGNPRLILLDEPLITLDTDSIKILYSWITEKYLRQNTSFIVSSHQPLTPPGILVQELHVENQTVTVGAWAHH